MKNTRDILIVLVLGIGLVVMLSTQAGFWDVIKSANPVGAIQGDDD